MRLSRSECETRPAPPCVNFVNITHAHGETSGYFHLEQFSARDNGIVCGMFVTQGTIIGIEGDVGITCGDDHDPRDGPCYESLSSDGQCERHLHWAVYRGAPDPNEPYLYGECCDEVSDNQCVSTPQGGELVNPMTCGVPGNIYSVGDTQTAAACSPSGCDPTSNLPPENLSGWGIFRVYQASNTVTASSFVIENQASAVMHAGSRVRLIPGFRAGATSYFRAEIGPCNMTAEAP